MKTSLQPDKLLKIYQQFPELNFVWLLIGAEAMVRTDKGNTINPNTNPDTTNMEFTAKINLLKDMLKSKDEELTNLKLRIVELETSLKQMGKQEGSPIPENPEMRRDAG